ncbi:MAG: DUF3568 family protein [Planctomycetota bacterium]
MDTKKTLRFTGGLALALVCGSAGLMTGCSTDAPGIKSNYVQQWTLVSGSVEEATAAAEDVLGEYDLKDVKTQSTKLDGMATGEMADGTEINVDIRKATDETSEVTVRVGTAGDPALGIEIAEKIKEELAG